ncbi:hypothetical protein CYY_007728 [Polysphondylium violaceum]|uniref:Uncharacterized protein n=1 Tax=Polysphondylium violaceum TaxID=133409 RepID=A0A8J4PQH5_9MYCE|nr:hypothetical protein CYY_007728 [Polysphondylium violaceum]
MMMGSIDTLYRDVFGNVYLSSLIFKCVHQIQINDFSFKYKDIWGVGWMITYGHIGLLRDKIKNDANRLYVCVEELFSIIANYKDISIFIALFELHKTAVLQYMQNNENYRQVIDKVRSLKIFSYLHNNGHLRTLETPPALSDYSIVEYLTKLGYLKISYLRPTDSSFK